jgi:predicted permease
VRQLLVESIQLSLLGGALGLVFAQAGVEAIVDLLASGANPILLDVQLNRTVLAFTIGLSTLTGIVFGLAPAFGVTRVDLAHALKVAGQGAANSHGWVSRHVLVGGQIALCVLLVSAAGLLGRTLRGLETREGGFERENVMMFTMDVEGTAFPAERFPQLCDELIDRLTPTYQLLAGSCSTSVPVHTRGNARPLVVPGGPSRSTEESLVFMNRISPEYFRAQGIQVVEGRALDSNDSESSEKVAVISRSAAAFFFGDENPIGRRVHFHNAEDVLFTVVGIVEDATQWSLRDDPFRTIYTPLTQLLEPETTLTVTLRSRRDPREFMGSVRAEVAALDSDVVVDYVRTMDQQIGGTLVRERVLALLSSAFGVVALVLSCVGLYGVIAYDVTRTARDIGIRLALGGQPGYVLGRVLGSAAGVTTLGVSIGLVATWFATRVLSSLLFGVTPRDPLTLAFAAAVIALTCLLAGYLPARRASRIDPVMVLRSE